MDQVMFWKRKQNDPIEASADALYTALKISVTQGGRIRVEELVSAAAAIVRDLVAEAIHRLLAEPYGPKRHRMREAPIKLPPGRTIPIRSNIEIAQFFDQDDVMHFNDVYRGR